MSEGRYYKLDGHRVVPCDVKECSKIFASSERIVRQETVENLLISTIFLGLNHNWSDGPPHIFETKVFADDEMDAIYCERCSTWEQAEAKHAEALTYIRKVLSVDSRK